MNHHGNCHVEPINKPLNREALTKATAVYLAVSGMGCPRCAMRVHNSLISLDGVLLADIRLETATALIAYDPQRVGIAKLEQAVAATGNDGRHNYRGTFLKEVPADQVLAFQGMA